MKKIDHGIVALTMLCMLLGTIIGVQFKTVRSQGITVDVQRVSELTAKLNTANAEKENLKKTLEENEKKIKEFENYVTEDSGGLKFMVEENSKLRMSAGLTNLEGRGITVTINDSKKAGQANQGGETDAFLVHAEDILSILNELNVAGVEAVSINGQRIVSNSPIRCVGSVVNVNEVKVAAPFVISAIGDPDILEASLVFPGGVVDSLRPWGIELNIKKLDKVEVPAYTQKIEFNESTQPIKG